MRTLHNSSLFLQLWAVIPIWYKYYQILSREICNAQYFISQSLLWAHEGCQIWMALKKWSKKSDIPELGSSPIHEVFSYKIRHLHTGYSIFYCDSIKYDLTLHRITLEYAVSCIKMPCSHMNKAFPVLKMPCSHMRVNNLCVGCLPWTLLTTSLPFCSYPWLGPIYFFPT